MNNQQHDVWLLYSMGDTPVRCLKYLQWKEGDSYFYKKAGVIVWDVSRDNAASDRTDMGICQLYSIECSCWNRIGCTWILHRTLILTNDKNRKREKIREVMRFSGPRMIIHHPIEAIRHLFK